MRRKKKGGPKYNHRCNKNESLQAEVKSVTQASLMLWTTLMGWQVTVNSQTENILSQEQAWYRDYILSLMESIYAHFANGKTQ